MTSDHQNRKKEPYHFFQDDYFEYSNFKIGPQTPEIRFLALLCPLKSYLFVDLRLEKVY